MDKFFQTLNLDTRASLLLRSSIPGFEHPCYEVQSPTQLSELIMSITQVAAEQAVEILDMSRSSSQQQDIQNAPRITSISVFHPVGEDSPEVYALCDSSDLSEAS
jgi:hypothetical protein